MSEKDDKFLARWARRKAQARKAVPIVSEDGPENFTDATGRAPIEAPDSRPVSVDSVTSESERTDETQQFDDIDYEKLDYSSDYTKFITKTVPAAIQRKALRKLWASDPVFAVLDGLNDYDEDFSDAALAVKTLSSAYQAGRGYGDKEEAASRGEEGRETDELAGESETGGGGEQLADNDDHPQTGDREPHGEAAQKHASDTVVPLEENIDIDEV